MVGRFGAVVALSLLAACGSGEFPELGADTNTVPEALIGRWGITAADCSGGAAAKGLMEVSAIGLAFYESRARIRDVRERSETRIVADADYVGEGQSWTRRLTLESRDGGRTLVRRETAPGEPPLSVTYRNCG
ncbi:MAG: hypothetical protein ACU0DJ_03700 [Paracoccus sp. (in: a-proteobacteria)]